MWLLMWLLFWAWSCHTTEAMLIPGVWGVEGGGGGVQTVGVGLSTLVAICTWPIVLVCSRLSNCLSQI